MRPCAHPDCPNLSDRPRCAEHQRQADRAYNAQPKRRQLYDAAWDAHSRQRRKDQPWCSMQDATCKGLLTVDHPSDAVLCMSHHKRVEWARARRTTSDF